MRRYVKILSLIFAVLLFATSVSFNVYAESEEEISQENTALSSGAGIYIEGISQGEFPLKNEFVTLSAEEQLGKMVEFAEKYGYDTIYFEAVNLSQANYKSTLLPMNKALAEESGLNPLKVLSALCREKGISLIAVVDPLYIGEITDEIRTFASKNSEYFETEAGGKSYYNPTVDKVKEYLVRIFEEISIRYDIDGILLSGFGLNEELSAKCGRAVEEALGEILSEIKENIKSEGSEIKLGMEIEVTNDSWSGEHRRYDQSEAAINSGNLDFIVLKNELSAYGGNDYRAAVEFFKSACDINGVEMISRLSCENTGAPVGANNAANSTDELGMKRYLSRLEGIFEVVESGYTELLYDAGGIAVQMKVQREETFDGTLEEKLYIPQEFAVTRPYTNNTVSWSGSRYVIMGTSAPDKPLYFEGEEVERLGDRGTFGIMVDVEEGTNKYEIKQGDETITVTIKRNSSSQSSVINGIKSGSMFPQYDQGIRAGGNIVLSCTAPYGATVRATVNGTAVSLNSVGAGKTGEAVLYEATYTVPEKDFSADEITALGTIEYTLQYNGKTTTYTSGGALYVVGTDAEFAVKIKDYYASVYAYKGDGKEGAFEGVTFRGAVASVKEVYEEYYLVSGDKMIVKSSAEVVVGESGKNTVNEVSFVSGEDHDSIILSGTTDPFFDFDLENNVLYVKLYNTEGIDEINVSESEILKEAFVTEEGDTTVITLVAKDSEVIWGYDIKYDVEGENKTAIYVKRAPRISDKDPAKPLAEVTVVLDCGHGFDRVGALGVAGFTGPEETFLNYMTTLSVKRSLEQLGATVIISNPDGNTMDFEERIEPARTNFADFFISLHHNTVAESTNSNNVQGLKVYYMSDHSAEFAENISGIVSREMGRENKGADQSVYHVTKMYCAPAILLELGYITNPAEYEKICTAESIYQSGYAVTKAIVQTIKEAAIR